MTIDVFSTHLRRPPTNYLFVFVRHCPSLMSHQVRYMVFLMGQLVQSGELYGVSHGPAGRIRSVLYSVSDGSACRIS